MSWALTIQSTGRKPASAGSRRLLQALVVVSNRVARMDRERRYWFPAKRFGWGWGPPATWQGWCVLLVFLALVLGDAFVVLSRYGQGELLPVS